MSDGFHEVYLPPRPVAEVRGAVVKALVDDRGWEFRRPDAPAERPGLTIYRMDVRVHEQAVILDLFEGWSGPDMQLAAALSSELGAASVVFVRPKEQVYRRIMFLNGQVSKDITSHDEADRAYVEAPHPGSLRAHFRLAFGERADDESARVERAITTHLEPVLAALQLTRVRVAGDQSERRVVQFGRPLDAGRFLDVRFEYRSGAPHRIGMHVWITRTTAPEGHGEAEWRLPGLESIADETGRFGPADDPNAPDLACRYLASQFVARRVELASGAPELDDDIARAGQSPTWQQAEADLPTLESMMR